MADSPTMRRRALLFGSGGMIGSALAKQFTGPHLSAFSHQDLDITDYVSLERSFLKHKPEIVLNAAAFTKVDDCEKFREAAFLSNAQAPGHLAALSARQGALLVHLSTDYVFDGANERLYQENDPANPVNYYGVTKWEGEKRIVASGCTYLILRTSWIFGRNGDNFVKKLLRRALAGAKLQAPEDQIGSPTYANDVAAAVLRLVSLGVGGFFHFANRGSCSRLEQARTVLQIYGLNNSVEAVKNDDLHLPAKRPRFSVMDTSRYAEVTSQMPRTWQQGIAEYVAYLKQNEAELRS